MKRKRLSKSQKICFVLLWMVLCVILFTTPSEKSLSENILIAVISGIIIIVGINARPKK
jgi:Na+/melibiose symporter-like transporter